MYGKLAGLFLIFASFLSCERADLFELASREHPVTVMYSTDNILFYDVKNDVRFPDTLVATSSTLYFKVVNLTDSDVYLVGTPAGGSILVFDDPAYSSSADISYLLLPGTETTSMSINFLPPAAGEYNTLGTVPYQETGDPTVWVFSFRAGGSGY